MIPLHPLMLLPALAHLPLEVTAGPGMFGPTYWPTFMVIA